MYQKLRTSLCPPPPLRSIDRCQYLKGIAVPRLLYSETRKSRVYFLVPKRVVTVFSLCISGPPGVSLETIPRRGSPVVGVRTHLNVIHRGLETRRWVFRVRTSDLFSLLKGLRCQFLKRNVEDLDDLKDFNFPGNRPLIPTYGQRGHLS